MSHRLVPMFAGVALVGVLIVGLISQLGFSHTTAGVLAQAETPTPTTTSRQTHPLPAELEFLRTMTPDQRFDHTLGGQMTFQNPQGQNVVLNLIPGRVTAITSTSLTMTPNGSNQTRSFNVTPTTWVIGYQQQGSLTAFTPGDRVVVYVVNNSDNAAGIVGPYFLTPMLNGYGWQQGHRMRGGPPTQPTATPTTQAPATATPVPSPTATP